MRGAAVAVMVLAFGCGKGADDRPGPSTDASTSPPAKAPPPSPEVYADGFYRNPGGTAVLTLPSSMIGTSTITMETAQGAPTFTAVTPSGLLVSAITLTSGLPPAVQQTTAERTYEQVLARRKRDISTLEAETRSSTSTGGAYTLTTHGPDRRGQVSAMAVVSSGAEAVVLVVIGPARPAADTIDHLLVHTRVGDTVLRLKDLKPSVKLDGAYATDRRDFRSFDPRGYGHSQPPDSALARDVEVLVQAQWLGLGRSWAWTYDVRDGKLVTKPLGQTAPYAGGKFALAAGGFTLDGERYTRIDDAKQP